ncbi:MAG: hypothetical protein AAF215_32570 [Cyanobacteria bacterium P01_A01_bin.123]
MSLTNSDTYSKTAISRFDRSFFSLFLYLLGYALKYLIGKHQRHALFAPGWHTVRADDVIEDFAGSTVRLIKYRPRKQTQSSQVLMPDIGARVSEDYYPML